MEHLIWNIDPIFIQFGFFKIRWYGLMFATGFVLSYMTMQWIYKREGKNLEELDNLLWYMAVATILGARLGHTLLYDPAYYISHPLKLFAIWEGGLASHGATIGIILGLYLYGRRSGDSFIWLLDRVSIPTALAGACIRVGNFFNSEILGTPTDASVGVIFARIDQIPRHPVQLYEAASYVLIYLFAILLYRQSSSKPKPGLVFGCFISLLFSARFILEYFKTEQAMYDNGLNLNTGQLLSIPFILAGFGFIIWSNRHFRQDPKT